MSIHKHFFLSILVIFLASCASDITMPNKGIELYQPQTIEKKVFIDEIYSNYPVQMFEPNATYDDSFDLTQDLEEVLDKDRRLINDILRESQNWKYTPYRLGGNDRNKGADCSWYVLQIYQKVFQISLPRSTIYQRKGGISIKKNKLKAGDLVFFKTRRTRNGMHVGIYLENNSFIHLSSKGGARIQSLDIAYWKNRFIGARRYEKFK